MTRIEEDRCCHKDDELIRQHRRVISPYAQRRDVYNRRLRSAVRDGGFVCCKEADRACLMMWPENTAVGFSGQSLF